jgi:hypothetical protein
MNAKFQKKEAATVVDLFFNEMARVLAEGDRVDIRRLCSFYVKKYKAYAGMNLLITDPYFWVLVFFLNRQCGIKWNPLKFRRRILGNIKS